MKKRARLVAACVVALTLGLSQAAGAAERVLDPEVTEMSEGTASSYGATEPEGSPLGTMANDYYNCVLYPSVVHKRTSSGKSSVGAKPYTKCTAGTPTKITHSSTLYKARWLGLNWEAMVTRSNSNTNQRNLTLKTVEWRCVNSNESNFIQRTTGTSVQKGRTFHAQVSTAKARLTCGN